MKINNTPLGSWKTQYIQDPECAADELRNKRDVFFGYLHVIRQIVNVGQILKPISVLMNVVNGYIMPRIAKVQLALIPGMTPLSFRAYYDKGKAEDSINYYLRKIKNYENLLNICSEAAVLFKTDTDTIDFFTRLKSRIQMSINKVSNKINFFKDKPQWFRKPNPSISSIGLDILEELNCTGVGIEIGVIERWQPFNHSSLANSISDFNGDTKKSIAHATGVCSLLAGNTQNYRGVLPNARLNVVGIDGSHFFKRTYLASLDSSNVRVINFNLGFKSEFITSIESANHKDIFDFNTIDDQTRFFEAITLVPGKEKLLVHAIGNGFQASGFEEYFGGQVGENPIFTTEFHYLNNKRLQENLLLVMNVEEVYEDGVLLASASNTPGDYYPFALCAPGTEILCGTVIEGKEDYLPATGTSFAAPFVTAIAAALQHYFPELSIHEVKRSLLEGAKPLLWINGRATFVDRAHLDRYSPELVLNSRRLFGMGYLDARGTFKVAQKILAEKQQSA